MHSQLKILFSKTPGNEDLSTPTYASIDAAGIDLRAAIKEKTLIGPGQRLLIPTGLKLMLPKGFEGQVRPRSGMALKHGITVLNSPGTIDADYRGEIGVLLINHGEKSYQVSRDQKIAQLIVSPVTKVALEYTESLPNTDRGTGGFGSTDTTPPANRSTPN